MHARTHAPAHNQNQANDCLPPTLLRAGPGYNDERIRPWNAHNTKRREGGQYYERAWDAAIAAGADAVSITSFNEWGEGTQIEAAAASKTDPRDGRRYLDYAPLQPDHYLGRTKARAAALCGSGGGAGHGGL